MGSRHNIRWPATCLALVLVVIMFTNARPQKREQNIFLSDSLVNGPVYVKQLRVTKDEAKRVSLIIEVENRSDKAIKTMDFWLAHPPCQEFLKAPGLAILYGDRKLIDPSVTTLADPVLAPAQRAKIVFKHKELAWFLDPKTHAKCPVDRRKPVLVLAKLIYEDGKMWDISDEPALGSTP